MAPFILTHISMKMPVININHSLWSPSLETPPLCLPKPWPLPRERVKVVHQALVPSPVYLNSSPESLPSTPPPTPVSWSQIYMHTDIYTHTYICVHIHTYMHTYLYTYIYACMNTHTFLIWLPAGKTLGFFFYFLKVNNSIRSKDIHIWILWQFLFARHYWDQ